MSVFSQHKQSGAVSLFVVIFTALLITVTTVSFVRLMVQDQQQATTTDLSQSAYDSAQAGVEDAKRALLRYQNACATGNTAECDRLRAAFGIDETQQTCDTLAKAGIAGEINGEETPIQQSVGDLTLDQAYTCVKIGLNTDDYLGDLRAEESKLIPLRGTSEFDTVEISWFNYQDLPVNSASRAITLTNDASRLPQTGAWSNRTPPLMRTQLMQYNDGFTLEEFDGDAGDGSNSKTLYLYPVSSGGLNTVEFNRYGRRSDTIAPSPVRCATSINSGGYACSNIRLTLPSPVGGGDARTAFLRLSAHYNNAHYSLKLYRGGTLVQFEGVQPRVDSTGRANDLFRRVESRVELEDATFPYPEAAIDINGNLCKNFLVTDQEADYASTCTP